MANIEIEVAARKYMVACRDGEEAHLRSVAELVNRRARDAAEALGSLSETRQLLFAALLLADDLKEARSGANGGANGAAAAPASTDPALADALEQLAERVEALADHLEQGAATS